MLMLLSSCIIWEKCRDTRWMPAMHTDVRLATFLLAKFWQTAKSKLRPAFNQKTSEKKVERSDLQILSPKMLD